MAEFMTQSEPVTPPSIPQITQKKESDPTLHMNNESNTFQGMLVGCVMLVVSIYLPLVMSSDSMKWVAVALASCATFTLIMVLYTYKRNSDAFEQGEQGYIDWKKSSYFVYTLGGILSIVCTIVLYELYWNASNVSKTQTSKSIVDDDVFSVKSGKSARSVQSAKTIQSTRSIGSRVSE